MTDRRPPNAWHPRALREDRALAQSFRRLGLVGIATGRKSVIDVVFDACAEPRSPLLKVKLLQLLISQPGVGQVSALRRLRHMLSLLGNSEAVADLNTKWLNDSRSGLPRYLAFREALGDFEGILPTPGFPFAGMPAQRPAKDPWPWHHLRVTGWEKHRQLAGKFTAFRRLDPFIEPLWPVTGRLGWTRAAEARRSAAGRADGGRGRALPTELAMSVEETLLQLTPKHYAHVWWTRLPGSGRNSFDFDEERLRLTRIDRWPAVWDTALACSTPPATGRRSSCGSLRRSAGSNVWGTPADRLCLRNILRSAEDRPRPNQMPRVPPEATVAPELRNQ